TGGTVTAAMLVPRGWDICRMPMARPRRRRGNHPMTTRPLAEFTEAAAAPEAAMTMTIRAGESTTATAIAEAKAVNATPKVMASRSPYLSAKAPQAMRVRMRPKLGAAATVPAWVRVKPRSECIGGMRNAGPEIARVAAICVRTPMTRIIQACKPGRLVVMARG